MSNSKSLKADKELMWKKLSTVQKPLDWPWGELTIIMSGRRTGKSALWKEFEKHRKEIARR